MSGIKAYVFRIVIAAIVCGIASSLLKEKTASGKIVNLLCGIIMAITILSPVVSISFKKITSYYSSISYDAAQYVNDGKMAAQESIADIIKSQTEAYILDKANRMGLQIAVPDGRGLMSGCDMVVTNSAIPDDNNELSLAKQMDIPVVNRNQLLGVVFDSFSKNILGFSVML